MKEICAFIKTKVGIARKRSSKFSFGLVYLDKRGKMQMKVVAQTSNTALGDGEKTLKELGFEAGDYLDVAIRAQ